MVDTYQRSLAEANYNAAYFRSMIAQLGAVETARKLLASPAVSDGFAALWERGMDLTIEALVIEPEFAELFSEEERDTAPCRLEQFCYTPDRQTRLASDPLVTELCAITYGTLSGSLAGGAFAALILALVGKSPLPDALTAVKAVLTTRARHEAVLAALDSAERVATSGRRTTSPLPTSARVAAPIATLEARIPCRRTSTAVVGCTWTVQVRWPRIFRN